MYLKNKHYLSVQQFSNSFITNLNYLNNSDSNFPGFHSILKIQNKRFLLAGNLYFGDRKNKINLNLFFITQ